MATAPDLGAINRLKHERAETHRIRILHRQDASCSAGRVNGRRHKKSSHPVRPPGGRINQRMGEPTNIHRSNTIVLSRAAGVIPDAVATVGMQTGRWSPSGRNHRGQVSSYECGLSPSQSALGRSFSNTDGIGGSHAGRNGTFLGAATRSSPISRMRWLKSSFCCEYSAVG